MKLKGFLKKILGTEESSEAPLGIRPATTPPAQVLRPAPVADPSPSSARAPGPPAGAAVAEAVLDPPRTPEPDTFDDSSDDIDLDAAFAGNLGGEDPVTYPPATAAEGDDVDEAALRELFVEIAAQHSDPMKSFMIELNRGNTSKEWIEVCQPIMDTLIEAAVSVGMTGAADRMTEYSQALTSAAKAPGQQVGGEERDAILRSYCGMADAIPEAFALGNETDQREGIILHSLLKQIPDVGYVTFERLYGSAVISLETLLQARADDLSSTTGIPVWLCERICNRMGEHRREMESIRRGGSAFLRKRLVELLGELRRSHQDYERLAEGGWSGPERTEKKRNARWERQRCSFAIEVMLAEFGETELAQQIQKLSFERRIHRLEEYLAGLRSSQVSAAPRAETG